MLHVFPGLPDNPAVLGTGHLLEGGGWAGANREGVIFFVHLKMGGCIKFCSHL